MDQDIAHLDNITDIRDSKNTCLMNVSDQQMKG